MSKIADIENHVCASQVFIHARRFPHDRRDSFVLTWTGYVARTSHGFGLREAPWSAAAAATALECGRGSERSAMQ